jgi:futalosine hydrolase
MTTRILIVSATELEIEPLFQLKINRISQNHFELVYSESLVVDILIAGVGIAAVTYSLTRFLSKNEITFAVLVGISGSYDENIKLGEVVNVMSERFADLGVIGSNSFTDLFEMKLGKENIFPFENGKLRNYTLINNETVNYLKIVEANTVNTIRHEVLSFIQKDSEIESMEGAAFFYVCLQEKVPFIQIRGISNYVGEQNKSKWDIDLAISSLNAVILEFLSELK